MRLFASAACAACAAVAAWGAAVACGGEATIHVDAGKPGPPVSRYLTGACIEDVNHEIYGGIYSQMIFGESFQEPAHAESVKGFWSPDGDWQVKDGEVSGGGGPGPKLISSFRAFDAGEAGVEVYMSGDGPPADGAIHNAGLIVAVGRAAAGADSFLGYEVSIDPGRRTLAVGRHQRNYRLLKEVPCDVPTNRWVALSARIDRGTLEAFLDGKSVLRARDDKPLPAGTVGLRQWQRPARYRNLWVKPGDGPRAELPFEPAPAPVAVSGTWGPVVSGQAVLDASIETQRPFTGSQSQRVTFARGEGEAGIENQGLNRRGMNFQAGKPYEGYVWLRAEKPLEVLVTLENRDGTATCARAPLAVDGGDEWRRYDFTLTPDAANPAGRFSLRLKSPGSVVVGHAFLQPGEWGRFKGLPIRRDVTQGLIDQGVTVLRYGGSMVNAPEYRWKKMIGPRDRRPPYKGTWYPQSSNGWGIVDFLDLCEAAGFLAIPDFNLDESPQDMADFVEYANGPADSEWGRRRAADGHPAPYHLRHVELGNEEKVDETYWRKFEALARATWAKDPQLILVVGDFQYEKPIADPAHVEGADSGITSLAAHRKILDLARQNDREVWFDVHVWTEAPGTTSARAFPGYMDAIDRLAEGARHHVVVFEFNANTHDQRRALANAGGIGAMIRDGRVPVALSANCLQPDGQNDNGWDQGLLFLNPTNVWLQPPGYVTRMFSHGYEPQAVEARVEGQGGAAADDGKLSVSSARSEDGKRLVVYVVNQGPEARPAGIRLDGFTPSKATAKVEELAGPPTAADPADDPGRLVPRQFEWRYEPKEGAAAYTFPANSFSVIHFD